MASKFGLAGGIPERRVRPIWDAIDSRQFKNALKHATTLLSKYPNSPYALALKALILERMGKCDEALSICLKAKEFLYKNESLLMDDLTLSTLQIVFQRLEHLDLATSCYEHACAKFPNNLELMMGLFNCYVREYSFVKQQQTAIKMYKLVGEEKFLLWAVCSIQLQVLCGNGGEKLLLLAEGLLKKHAVSHSLHEPEALIVYISILEQQAKYGDALDLISGKLGSLLMIEVDKLRIQGKLLARAGDYAAALTVYQKIIELCPDDWEAFLHYLGCLFEDDSSWSSGTANDPIHPSNTVECKLSHLVEEIFDARISDAQKFVESLRADLENSSLRCSYIAILEIERRKHLFGKNNYDGIVKALLEYYTRFGHMACFTSDVEVFLQVLSTDKKVDFLERLMKSSNSCAETPTKALGYSITVFKIQELIGSMSEFSVAELESSAVQMVELYCKNLPLSKDLDPQESVVGEELICMVCNILVHLFWRTRFPGYLIEAIMVLEFGLSIRRYVWQYKVLLVHLYSHLGVVSLAFDWYKSLDVKNILMETVSHHILPQMLASPLWSDLNSLLKEYLRFMDEHLRESADLTFLAYRHRNYSKVIEFVQFKERLQRSNQYLVAKIESSVLQLKQNADDIEVQENTLESLKFGVHFVELSNEIRSKSMTFNEDFQSRPWWTPVPERNYLLGPFEGISYYPKENLAEERKANVRRAVERRSLLPRMVYLSIQSASSPLKENTEMNGSSSDSKISLEFKSLLDCMAKMLGYSLSDAINKVMAASRELQISEAFDSNTVDWLNFAVFLNAWNCGSREVFQQDAECWLTVNSLLERYILDKMRLMEPLICSPGHDVPELVQLVTEPFAWHCLVISSSVRSCHPVGKKKKKSGLTDQSIYLTSHAVREAIQLSSGIMEKVTRWLKELINRPEDELMDTILSSIKGSAENGPGRVLQTLETFRSSINDLEHGHQIAESSRSWHHVDVARKMVTGQCIVLSEFLRICESKIKMLDALKQQIAQL